MTIYFIIIDISNIYYIVRDSVNLNYYNNMLIIKKKLKE